MCKCVQLGDVANSDEHARAIQRRQLHGDRVDAAARTADKEHKVVSAHARQHVQMRIGTYALSEHGGRGVG